MAGIEGHRRIHRTTRQLACGWLPFQLEDRIRSQKRALGTCSLRLLDGQYVRLEDPFPGVADKDHKLTCGDGVGVNAPRLLSGPFSQVVDVWEGRIGQNVFLAQLVLDDGFEV